MLGDRVFVLGDVGSDKSNIPMPVSNEGSCNIKPHEVRVNVGSTHVLSLYN